MGENMNYPDNPIDFIKKYSFSDKLRIYTNGSDLISVFRVGQMIEQLYAWSRSAADQGHAVLPEGKIPGVCGTEEGIAGTERTRYSENASRV